MDRRLASIPKLEDEHYRRRPRSSLRPEAFIRGLIDGHASGAAVALGCEPHPSSRVADLRRLRDDIAIAAECFFVVEALDRHLCHLF